MPSRRSPSTFPRLIPTPVRLAPKSHEIISFADPHPLTLLKSYRFKNSAGGGYSGRVNDPYLKLFRCNTYREPHKCCKQRIYGLDKTRRSLLGATLTKTRGIPPPGRFFIARRNQANLPCVSNSMRVLAAFVSSGHRRARNETEPFCFVRARSPFLNKKIQISTQLVKSVECPLLVQAFAE